LTNEKCNKGSSKIERGPVGSSLSGFSSFSSDLNGLKIDFSVSTNVDVFNIITEDLSLDC
jgi:hypothetical protein